MNVTILLMDAEVYVYKSTIHLHRVKLSLVIQKLLTQCGVRCVLKEWTNSLLDAYIDHQTYPTMVTKN